MKIFKKYILPFLILYVALAMVVAMCVCWMNSKGYVPLALSEFQFVLIFLICIFVSVSSGIILLNYNKNIKAIYSNISKQPLLVVCVGEGLYAVNSLMSNLFDGLVLGSLIVVFPLALFAIKSTRDIKEVLS